MLNSTNNKTEIVKSRLLSGKTSLTSQNNLSTPDNNRDFVKTQNIISVKMLSPAKSMPRFVFSQTEMR